ncbi:TVG0696003 [Thermoplasma volcanium GSS1]|uniref:TVG0696003 protein n=1 Tax=Thermoplasma volcanium (strain ATCC 51530 / DSM 4299 / JCM 9571 / NBRC 15438 / GSS1) TaxID=273116 RepID=Q97AX2_THEVO|nr:cellulase family glycosylhydrolase [Thermoplasma volcanium]BAB59829.1 TVG0696003 [Thermoplasma volcanium GSS1]
METAKDFYRKGFRLGVNFWPRLANIKMWKEWNEQEILDDLKEAKNIGCDFLRVFILDEDFVNAYGEINVKSMAYMTRFLDMCSSLHLKVFITFIVGHMSGRNWVIPWAPDNNIYESKAIMNFSKFVEHFVNEYKTHPAIEGWLMSNEITLVKRPSSPEQAMVLESVFYGIVKNLDPDHTVSSGDVLSFLQQPPNIRNHSDYAGLHLYFYDNDLLRQRYSYGSLLNIFSNDGSVPVFLEEFGFSTNQGTEKSQGEFIYSTLWTALANESMGGLVWCFSDFIGEEDPPYDWRPLEINFGLIRADGTRKYSAEKFLQFSIELKELENMMFFQSFQRIYHEISVIVPFYAYADYTSVSEAYSDYLFNRIPNPILTSLLLCKMASLQPTVFYENDLEDHINGKKLLIIPSVPTMRATTWNRLLKASVDSDIHIMASTFRGSEGSVPLTSFHDSFTHIWEKLFGVKTITELGSKGIPYSGNIEIIFTKEFGPFKKGQHINMQAFSNTYYCYSIEATKAQIIAVDKDNRPVFTYNEETRAYLFSIPFELVLTVDDTGKYSKPFMDIYREIARRSGIKSLSTSTHPAIEVADFSNGTKNICITINHSTDTVQSTIKCYGINPMMKMGNAKYVKNCREGIVIIYPPGGVALIESSL